jgi:hypothetical protein
LLRSQTCDSRACIAASGAAASTNGRVVIGAYGHFPSGVVASTLF